MKRLKNSRPIWPSGVLSTLSSLALCCLVTFPLGACKNEAHQPTAEKAPEPKAPQPESETVTLTLDPSQLPSVALDTAKTPETVAESLTGRLVWDETCTVRIFSSVAGRVHQIRVNAGQHVKEGDTLATMFSVDFGQAQADASKAEADLKLSERTYIRTKDLFQHGAAAQKDVEAAEDDFETKKAERSRAFARLSLYGAESGTVDGLFPLKAPISGLVVEKNLNPGQEVRPDQMLANDSRLVQPLFVISDPTRLSILLDVTELDIAALRPGQTIKVRTRAFPDHVFQGKLEYIGDSLDPMTRTVKVRGSMENPDGALKAEMYVSADVVTMDGTTAPVLAPKGDQAGAGTHKPIEVSSKALFMKDNHYFVFVEKTPGTYERHPVDVAVERGGKAFVTSGLSPGNRVVTEGNLLLEAKAEEGK